MLSRHVKPCLHHVCSRQGMIRSLSTDMPVCQAWVWLFALVIGLARPALGQPSCPATPLFTAGTCSTACFGIAGVGSCALSDLCSNPKATLNFYLDKSCSKRTYISPTNLGVISAPCLGGMSAVLQATCNAQGQLAVSVRVGRNL